MPADHSLSVPRIRGTTDLIVTVADPVAQVKAPEALNLVFARFGIDAVVVPAKVAVAGFDAFVRGALAADNVRGMLVSIPHKTRLAALVGRADAAVRLSGAANAVRRAAGDGGLEAGLFDGSGFLGALRHYGVPVAGQRVLLVGAGGAGLAIAAALAGCADEPALLAVFDTQPARAQALVDQIRRAETPRHTRVEVAPAGDPDGFDLVINATPLGLQPSDPLPVDPHRLGRDARVVDILMKNQPTALERACAEAGIAVFSGHEMMVQQIPDYLQFFGFDEAADALRGADHPVMHAVRRAMLGERAALH